MFRGEVNRSHNDNDISIHSLKMTSLLDTLKLAELVVLQMSLLLSSWQPSQQHARIPFMGNGEGM